MFNSCNSLGSKIKSALQYLIQTYILILTILQTMNSLKRKILLTFDGITRNNSLKYKNICNIHKKINFYEVKKK